MKWSASPFFKLKLRNVLFITIGWIIIGVIVAVYNHFIGKSVGELEYSNYDLRTNIITNVISTFFAGILGGALLVFVLKDKFRKKPLGLSIIIYMISITLIIVAISVIAYAFYNWYYGDPLVFDTDFSYNFKQYLGTNTFWLNMVTWAIVSGVTIITLQINDKYGQGVFLNMLLGKYHRPKKEQRIFMFMDMRSSTKIAEEIGHRKYFKLLNDLTELMTEPIVNSHGEIYQYVGDEVVVTWIVDKDLPRENSIKCFFEIQKKIQKNSKTLMRKYGYIPEFKAGMHCGDVTTGEIGTYKKEIVFTGDTVNTTARIEAKCNELQEEILISENLVKSINDDGHYSFRKVCTIELKGKKDPVNLYTVTSQSFNNSENSLGDTNEAVSRIGENGE